MSAEHLQRVRYREGQLLRQADLELEQRYHLSQRRRHNIAHHAWGIVTGLEVGPLYPGDSQIWAKPGLAVDGFGRELILPRPVLVENDLLDQVDAQCVDLWLVYQRVPVSPPQDGRWDCGPDRNSRWREEAWLELTPASSDDMPEPRVPIDVTAADLEYAPHMPPVDDPDRVWPVYLGRVERKASGGYDRVAGLRPCAGLSGALITSASGTARLQVGSETRDDRRRLGVSIPDDWDQSQAFSGSLAIERDGKLEVAHETMIDGADLILDCAEQGDLPVRDYRRSRRCPRELEARHVPSIQFMPLDSPPAAAAPWQIYHVAVERDGQKLHQLRIELGHPGDKGDPAQNMLIIGTDDQCKKSAEAPLSVSADCSVRVGGAMKVNGQIIQGPVDIDPDDPRFGNEMLARWLDGLTTAGGHVDSFYNTLKVEISAPTRINPDTELKYTVTVRNVSSENVTEAMVVGTLTLLVNGTQEDRKEISYRPGDPEGTLKPGSSTKEGSYQVPDCPPGQIIIALSAAGLGVAGSPVHATARASIQVVAPEP